MPQNWRPRTLLTLFFLVLSAYVLVPTIFGFDRVREDAEANGKEVPFYVNLFPKDVIKLGLDLRGGIYAEVEVEIDDAVKNKADLISGEISRLTEKEAFAPAS